MTAAYEKVLARMSADDLLAAAKEAAQKQLDKLYGSAKKNYKDITEQLDKLYETQTAAIEACTKSADTDTELDRFSAGVADLLIAARVKSGAAMRELAAALPEVRQVYDALTAAPEAAGGQRQGHHRCAGAGNGLRTEFGPAAAVGERRQGEIHRREVRHRPSGGGYPQPAGRLRRRIGA